MDVDELVMSDGGQLNGMKLAGFFGVQPREECVHEDVHFLRLRRYVVADVDLRSSEDSSLDGIHMAEDSLVNLEDVVEGNVVVPKRDKQSLKLQSAFMSSSVVLTLRAMH